MSPKYRLRATELRNLTVEELQQRLREQRMELMKELTKKQAAGGIAENPGKLREIRKNIARILTILNEKLKSAQKEIK
ncbi:MAG: 50S ribosomal protein L29 [bacterium]|nr:50S ribosomal protein L29 [bacterium]